MSLVALVLAFAQQADDLAARLASVVDQPSAAARKAAAIELARSCGGKLDELFAAARNFGVFETRPGGSRVERAPLPVGGKTEETELHLCVPDGYDASVPAPLVLAFHGTGGGGAQMLALWSAVARESGVLVLAPSEAGANDGYHFSERERLAALAALRWMRRRFNVDENRIFATGVSRGGHLAWDLALRQPDLFAGIAPMIGGPRITIQNGQNNLRYVENVASLSIRDLQGAKDDPALVASVQLAFEKLKTLGARDAQLFLQPEHGHWFDLDAVDWKAWFASARREPSPTRVVRSAAREDEGRAFWAEITAYSPSVDETFVPEVSELKWAGMSEDERRRQLAALADLRTARLEIRRDGPGRFSARSDKVKRFRVLLEAADLGAKGDFELSWNGDTTKKRLRPTANVLLAEFAERFDRTFLPVAELEIR